MNTRSVPIITFSGIDGAGKTTQIQMLSRNLEALGFQVAHVCFWDEVAVFPKFRAGVSLRAFRNSRSKGDGATRSDKNVRTWYLTLLRSPFYLLDTLNLRRVIARVQLQSPDFIIFDRYYYDQVVQLRSQGWLARMFRRLLIALAPDPNFAFILDAHPAEAFRRKPEYPLAFLYEYRRGYLGLPSLIPGIQVIAAAPPEMVQRQILERVATYSSDRGATPLRSAAQAQ
jgi:thymidylate kinase